MPPKRGRGKATKNHATATRTIPKGVNGKAKKSAIAAVMLRTPPELWRMIIDFACTFELEFDYSPRSARAKAALGLVGNPASDDEPPFDYIPYLKGRKLALQTRRNLLLVCKSWNEMAKDHTYTTVVISDSSRPFITGLITRFLANPSLGDRIRRLELNFSVNRYSVELIGAQVRGLLKHCKNVEVVDDHVRREANKRSVSPIEISAQAIGEIPFAVAMGNRAFGTLKHARFSRGSTAAFTLEWFITLMQRLRRIEIVCLSDFPGWGDLPITQENPRNNPGNNGNGARRRRSSRDSEDSDEGDDSDSDPDDADDEDFAPPDPLDLEHVHTLNMAQIKETKNVQFANAFTKYVCSWGLPAVEQLALSIYNAECIPTLLLKQVGDNLTTLCLHHFNVSQARANQEENATTVTGSRPQASRTMTLDDRKVVLPKVHTVMVIPSSTSTDWVDIFSTPNLKKYILSYYSYSPTPHDPSPVPLDPEHPPKEDVAWFGPPTAKLPWGEHWKKLRAQLELVLDRTKMPCVEEVWMQDCQFMDAVATMSDDMIDFFNRWEEKLKEIDVDLTGGQGERDEQGKLGRPPTWSEAKAVWTPLWDERRAQKAAKLEERKRQQEQKEQEKKLAEDARKRKVEEQKAKEAEAAAALSTVEGQTLALPDANAPQSANDIEQADSIPHE